MKKKILSIILLVIASVFLCACGSKNEKCNEISEYLVGKTFYDEESDCEEKYADSYLSPVTYEKVSGGTYYVWTIGEGLLTFNDDGSVDFTHYNVKRIETKFTEEQKKYAEIEDSFTDHSYTVHYDSFSVEQEDDDYIILLYKEGKKEWTIKYYEDVNGIYYIDCEWLTHMREEEEISSLPSKDYNR